jgi:iron(III) transport system permease protein
LGVVVLVPLAVIVASWVSIDAEIWGHLASTTLPELLVNTAILVLGVGAGTVVLGVSLAWLTTTCEFPGRRWLDWALMLPFALPAYVLAFVFLGAMDFSGPIQGGLRVLFGLPANWALEVRNAGGVVFVMTLVLYPYVYMLARVAFVGQGGNTFEAARSLGLSPLQAFHRVSLPMARPAIIAGLSLALMEALADFGAVAVFNFDTFTTAIYKAWFGFFDLRSAAQLASLLLALVLVALTVERHFRARSRYAETSRSGANRRFRLTGWRRWAASAYALTIFLLAFAAPAVQLGVWAWESRVHLDARYADLLWHTFVLGASAAVITVTGAFVLAFTQRYYGDRLTRLSVRVGTLGYALPGSVLAVGVMLSLTWIDNRLADAWLWLTGHEPGLLLAGTVISLLLAYFARFLAVAFGPVDSALERIRPSLREAARSLGAGQWEVVRRVYVPILRPGLLTAGLLVLVDVMKEMPATLLLRPFGWDTLAVRIYELTSEGEWERAALPAVALVLVGLVPVVLLVRRSASG